MKDTVLGKHRVVSTRLGHCAWVLVAFCVPVERMITSSVSPLVFELVIVLLVLSASFGRVSIPSGGRSWYIVMFLCAAGGFISGFNSSMAASTLTGALLGTLLGISPFVLSYYIRHSKHFSRNVIVAFLGSQTISACLGLLQLSGNAILGQTARLGRINGLAGHPNVLGIMAVIAVLILTGLILSGRVNRVLAVLPLLSINTFALIFTGSLSSMLSLGVGLIVLLIAVRAMFRTVLSAIVCFLMVGVLYIGQGPQELGLATVVTDRIDVVTGNSDSGTASLDVREQTYAHAWNYIMNESWFVGVGMDGMNAGTFDGFTVVHNFLLRSWYQGGFLLFLAAIIVTGNALLLIGRSLRYKRVPLGGAVLAALATFSATAAFYTQYQYWLPVLFIFALQQVKLPTNRKENDRKAIAYGKGTLPHGVHAPTPGSYQKSR
ncbi:O-antigen ligase [Arthrobacter sp. Marseille-P9274]|uniref:O-antigen ligase family protein n=1 Tax=Arthrobacter sp. Marseille-P9274 TaxID=2866572 RepID=UPI0021C6A945|nr:O-antigen ligase family protein [Arthrobacter sp. Marseille-P9274]